jgi:hypothetical protein
VCFKCASEDRHSASTASALICKLKLEARLFEEVEGIVCKKQHIKINYIFFAESK